jgi:hypothetical protein
VLLFFVVKVANARPIIDGALMSNGTGRVEDRVNQCCLTG